jgi:16S rRNA (cytosine1402-N4)-methyltransferase
MKHISVLLDETIEGLLIQPTGTYVDATLGGGGHAAGILSRLTLGKLFGFDQDLFALEQTKQHLSQYQDQIELIHANFSQLQLELTARHIQQVDGILMDIGVSSFQLDDPARGFSYHHDAPLDMRMDNTQALTAAEIVNTYESDQLKALFTLGEVPFTNRLVEEIIRVRAVHRSGSLAATDSPRPSSRAPGSAPVWRTARAPCPPQNRPSGASSGPWKPPADRN